MKENFEVLVKLENLYLKLIPILRRFPKVEKYTLAERIETEVLDLIEYLHDFKFNPQGRGGVIRRARTKVHNLFFLIRISMRSRFISSGQYEEISLILAEIGKICTGLFKGLNEKDKRCSEEIREL